MGEPRPVPEDTWIYPARDKLYAQTIGHGPDLVLVHGWGMHSGVWEDVVEALADDYRVTLMDLPGHGYSRLPEAGHALADLVAAVADIAPPTAAWVGWSLGGLVVQRLAIDAPERIERIALICSSPCFVRRSGWPHAMHYPVLHQFAEGLRSDYRGTLKRFLALEVNGAECAREQLRALKEIVFQHGDPDPAALADCLAILETTDLRGELSAITCPALLLMGGRDMLVPVSAGAAMRELLPQARLHVFTRAGHAPFFSHLNEFTEHLRAFMDE